MGAAFKVKQSALKTGSQELRQYRNTLRAIHTSVEETRRVMSGMQGGVTAICGSLSKINIRTDKCAENINDMAGALENIAELYRCTETTLVGNIKDNIKTQNDKHLDSAISDWFGDIIIGKAYILPMIIGFISPTASSFLLGSGILANSSNSVSADASWLGYEFDQDHPGVTAWIGKASAEVNNDSLHAGVNGYLGKGEAEFKADGSFMRTKITKEYKDGKWTEKESLEFITAELDASASVAAVAGDAEVEIGDDTLGVEAKAEGAAGSAGVGVKGKFSVGEDGVNANVSGEAMVTAVEGKASGTINILGLEITGKVGGYAGALGVEGKAGIEGNKFVLEGGGAALIGGSVGIEIGFNDEGWGNFIDFITFWD